MFPFFFGPFVVVDARSGLGLSRPSFRPRKREAALRMEVGVRGLSEIRFGEFVCDDGLGRPVFWTSGEDDCWVFLGRGGVLVAETLPFSFVGCGGLKLLMLDIELLILAREDRRGIMRRSVFSLVDGIFFEPLVLILWPSFSSSEMLCFRSEPIRMAEMDSLGVPSTMTDLGRYLGSEEAVAVFRGLKEDAVRLLSVVDWGDVAVDGASLAPFSSTDDLLAFCNVPLVRLVCVIVVCEAALVLFT